MSRPTTTGESSRRVVRFIHSSDLHLDRPPHGLADIADSLREHFIECPYAAAEQVFELAISEEVDALVLSGNVVDLGLAGPRAIVFLLEQFRRLEKKKITVYWAGGKTDPPGAWPPSAPLPENVHTFPVGRVESFTLTRSEQPIAKFIGTSVSHHETFAVERLRRDSEGLPTVGLLCGEFTQDSIESSRVDYLALGGHSTKKTFTTGSQTAHYSGAPQGRSPHDPGPHGCALVTLDSAGMATIKRFATDIVRWHTETVPLDAATTMESLEAAMEAKVKALQAKSGERDLILTWRLKGEGGHLAALRRGGTETLAGRLQNSFGHRSPIAWTQEIILETTSKLPAEWYEQQTILGDVLRRIQAHQKNHADPLDLSVHLSEADRLGELRTLADLSDRSRREEVLAGATSLAADLLGTPPTK